MVAPAREEVALTVVAIGMRARCDIFLSIFFTSGAMMEATMTNTLAIMLKPIRWGWAVQLTDGRLLARFWGPRAYGRALQYATRSTEFAAPA